MPPGETSRQDLPGRAVTFHREAEAPVPFRQPAVATRRPGERNRGRIRQAGGAWTRPGKENAGSAETLAFQGRQARICPRLRDPKPLIRPRFARPPSPTRGEGGVLHGRSTTPMSGSLPRPLWERIGSPGKAEPSRWANLVRGAERTAAFGIVCRCRTTAPQKSAGLPADCAARACATFNDGNGACR